MTRYQVRVPSPDDYSRIVELLRAEASVLLELPRRRTLSVEDLHERTRERIVSMGATVEPEYQYMAGHVAP